MVFTIDDDSCYDLIMFLFCMKKASLYRYTCIRRVHIGSACLGNSPSGYGGRSNFNLRSRPTPQVWFA